MIQPTAPRIPGNLHLLVRMTLPPRMTTLCKLYPTRSWRRGAIGLAPLLCADLYRSACSCYWSFFCLCCITSPTPRCCVVPWIFVVEYLCCRVCHRCSRTTPLILFDLIPCRPRPTPPLHRPSPPPSPQPHLQVLFISSSINPQVSQPRIL